jgi:hypothetical protein
MEGTKERKGIREWKKKEDGKNIKYDYECRFERTRERYD